ncbi:MAG TPA: hypothetical protein VET23_12025 [Chitinophagaceae bacterium]|nr:hypothetical protein [Chitinophagaceae bacterium]
MNKSVSIFFAALFLISITLFGQNNTEGNQKLTLVCPFKHGSGREPKEAFSWDPPDKKVVMISKTDSIVRSCIKGTVVKVEAAEDNHYELVINVNELYFWYYAVMKPLVVRGQNVSPGETIGIYTLGTELEFRMFKEEDMQDPRDLLECKVPKAE